MPTVKVMQYIIIIEDFSEEGLKSYYHYQSLEEAERYYVIYRNSFKGCKITLLVILKEEII